MQKCYGARTREETIRWPGRLALLGLLLLLIGCGTTVTLPDGPARIAFVDRTGSIVTILPDGSDPQILSNVASRAELLRWSPDRRWLAVLRRDSDWETFKCDLEIIQADGKESRLVSLDPWIRENLNLSFPWWMAWSPDSQKVAVVSSAVEEENGVARVAIIDIKRGEVQPILELGEVWITNIAWLPDGQHLTITPMYAEMEGIYTLRSDGSDLQRMQLEEEDDYTAPLLFSPQGERLAYATYSDSSARARLYIARADGRDPVLVTEWEWEFWPNISVLEWSSDGSQLLFFEYDTGNICLYDVHSGQTTTVPEPEYTSHDYCTLSPDGQKLACESWYGEYLYLVDLETGESELLIEEVWGEGTIDW